MSAGDIAKGSRLNACLGGLLGYGMALGLGLPVWGDWTLMGDRFDFTVVAALLAFRLTPRSPSRIGGTKP